MLSISSLSTGVAHEPKFTVKAQINGENFEAIGLSKQKAKSKVAVLALRQLGFGNILGEELTDEGFRKEAPIWNYEPFGTKTRKFLNSPFITTTMQGDRISRGEIHKTGVVISAIGVF